MPVFIFFSRYILYLLPSIIRMNRYCNRNRGHGLRTRWKRNLLSIQGWAMSVWLLFNLSLYLWLTDTPIAVITVDVSMDAHPNTQIQIARICVHKWNLHICIYADKLIAHTSKSWSLILIVMSYSERYDYWLAWPIKLSRVVFCHQFIQNLKVPQRSRNYFQIGNVDLMK